MDNRLLKTPLLSVIVPTYNSEQLIHACLDSILKQSFDDFEILIMDGLSTDKTIEKILEQKDARIKLISEKDKGIYDAMNKSLALAKGEWIYFLGSDDRLADANVFKKVFVDNQNVLKNSDYVYGNVLWGEREEIFNGRYDIYELYKQNICHQAIFVKKKVFDAIGFFNLSYKTFADWDFNIRCFLSKEVCINYLNIIVAKYSLDGESMKHYDQVFMNDKDKIFFKYLSRLPYYKRIKFRSLFWRPTSFFSKIKYIYYLIIYKILWVTRFILKGRAA